MATFSRVKTWVSNEVLTAADLNVEFDNVINNMTPSGIEDASQNVAAMQSNTDPGGVGTESLATNLLGEIQRLRFVIKRIVGDQWYSYAGRSLKAGDLKIKTADIDASEVDTVNIKDAAVTEPKIADGAVSENKIAVGAVTYKKLGPINTAYSTIVSYLSNSTHADFEDVQAFGSVIETKLTPNGRPVMIHMLSSAYSPIIIASHVSVVRNGSSGSNPFLRIRRVKVSDSSEEIFEAFQLRIPDVTTSVGGTPPLPTVSASLSTFDFNPCFSWLDLTAEAGEEYSYRIQCASGDGTGSVRKTIGLVDIQFRVTEI